MRSLEERVSPIGHQYSGKGTVGRLDLPWPSQAIVTQGIKTFHRLMHRGCIAPCIHKLTTKRFTAARGSVTGCQKQHQAHQYEW